MSGRKGIAALNMAVTQKVSRQIVREFLAGADMQVLAKKHSLMIPVIKRCITADTKAAAEYERRAARRDAATAEWKEKRRIAAMALGAAANAAPPKSATVDERLASVEKHLSLILQGQFLQVQTMTLLCRHLGVSMNVSVPTGSNDN